MTWLQFSVDHPHQNDQGQTPGLRQLLGDRCGHTEVGRDWQLAEEMRETHVPCGVEEIDIGRCTSLGTLVSYPASLYTCIV